jgi:hypothetical protein
LEALRTVTALYEYAATSEEEISIAEDATYSLYEDDGEWSLIGATDRKEVGYAPTAYLEDQSQGQGGSAPTVVRRLASSPPLLDCIRPGFSLIRDSSPSHRPRL